MTAMRFVDTNILLYAIGKDPAERSKFNVAHRILDEGNLGTSVQVLQEFFVQATRKTRPNAITHEQAATLVEAFARFPVQDNTLAVMQAAMQTSLRFRISYWDAAVVEAARLLGCREVLTEDLNAGQDFNGVRVVNPFAA